MRRLPRRKRLCSVEFPGGEAAKRRAFPRAKRVAHRCAYRFPQSKGAQAGAKRSVYPRGKRLDRVPSIASSPEQNGCCAGVYPGGKWSRANVRMRARFRETTQPRRALSPKENEAGGSDCPGGKRVSRTPTPEENGHRSATGSTHPGAERGQQEHLPQRKTGKHT